MNYNIVELALVDAINQYGEDHVDLWIHNPCNKNNYNAALTIMYHSRHNSFQIGSCIDAILEDSDIDRLEKMCDNLNIGFIC